MPKNKSNTMPKNKSNRAAAAQAPFKDAENAPEGANATAPIKPTKAGRAPKLPKGKLFVVKCNLSNHIFSAPLPKAKAEEALKKIEEKERREHPHEAQYEFGLVPFKSDEN